MRVLVCGSRTFEDGQTIWNVLRGFNLPSEEPFIVIHGAAPGADTAAGDWASAQRSSRVGVDPYPADWKRNGKAAGPIRNQRMLDKGKPDIVLAFVDKPLQDSVGTYDMVKRARRANVPVYLIWRM